MKIKKIIINRCRRALILAQLVYSKGTAANTQTEM